LFILQHLLFIIFILFSKQDCANEQQQSSEDVFCVISAFDVPRFQFNPDLKKYEQAPKMEHTLFDSADAKAQLFRDR